MMKILYECQYFKIRVRDVMIVLVMLLLLFFGLRGCSHEQEKKKEKMKEEKIVNICDFTNENINDFNKLLSRVDLCSEDWFKDFDAYIVRIEDQNVHLKKKTEKEYKTVFKHQVNLLKELKTFKKSQEDENIDKLEEAFKDYKDFYDGKCGKDKGK